MSWKQPLQCCSLNPSSRVFFVQPCLEIANWIIWTRVKPNILLENHCALRNNIFNHQCFNNYGENDKFSVLLNIFTSRKSFFSLTCLWTIVIMRKITGYQMYNWNDCMIWAHSQFSKLIWCVTVECHITPAPETLLSLFELMLSTCKMAGKVIFVFAHLTTDVALEWVFVAVTSHVNGVQDIIAKVNLTMLASL